jgi:hypothetical protein
MAMTFVPTSGVLSAVVAAGPVAGAMGFLLIGLLASVALMVVLGAERKRPTRCLHPVVALRRKPPDDRAAAA